MKVLIVVDMQKDFVDGSLGTKEAQAIVPLVAETIHQFADPHTAIIFTKDTHTDNYMNTQEGKNLPIPHCIIGTEGWEVVDELKPFIDKYVDKPSFGYNKWAEFFEHCDSPDEIVMFGVCSGICVASNFAILKANYPEIPITVYKDLCACITPESHEAAINTMKVQQAIIV